MDRRTALDVGGELASRVEGCLRAADALGLTEAGIHLDMALVALRGTGLPPPDEAAASPLGERAALPPPSAASNPGGMGPGPAFRRPGATRP